MAKNINSFPQIVYTYINPLFTLCDRRKLKIDLYFVKLVKGFLAKYRIHIQNLEFSELCSACSSFNALVFWTKSLNTIRFIFFFDVFVALGKFWMDCSLFQNKRRWIWHLYDVLFKQFCIFLSMKYAFMFTWIYELYFLLFFRAGLSLYCFLLFCFGV